MDGGPVAGLNLLNAMFADVKFCIPGTTQCALVDHMLVDTGSVGTRVFASALPVALLDPHSGLPQVRAPSGALAGECLNFASGFTWGGVRRADVRMGGDIASTPTAGSLATSVSVQVISDTDPALSRIPSNCASQGVSLNTASAVGAKGILGVGLFAQDCGTYCTQYAPPVYYSCPSAGACANSTMPVSTQVPNPIARMATNNNGNSIVLPALPNGVASRVDGYMLLGIGTAANNGLAAGSAALATTGYGTFSSIFNGNTLPRSFFDSGSSVNFIPSAGAVPLPTCARAVDFMCPTPPVILRATNTGAASTSSIVDVFIANADAVFAAFPGAHAIAGLASPVFSALPQSLDLGASVFFGRSVATLIQGKVANGIPATGPAFAHTR